MGPGGPGFPSDLERFPSTARSGLGVLGPTAPICKDSCILCAPGRGRSGVSLFCLYLRGSFFQSESGKKINPQLAFVDEMLGHVLVGEKERKKKKSNI